MRATRRGRLDRDTGPACVERGSPRWVVALGIFAGGSLLVISVFLDWVHIAIGRVVQASVSGAGTVSVTQPQDDPELHRYAAQALEQVVSHSGVWVAVIGVLIVAADAAYVWLRPRAEAAVAVAVLAGVGAVYCLSCAFNVRRLFRETLNLEYVRYSLGIGMVIACTMTVILGALGVTAFVMEESRPNWSKPSRSSSSASL